MTVCEAESKFGEIGEGRWPSQGCQGQGLHVAWLEVLSAGLRFRSLGVTRGVEALSSEVWVQMT